MKGPRSIILVSDGIDTCAPPAACDVAKELAAAGTELSIHSIGFKVDASARAELECIATATGGTYSDAGDGAALTDELTIRTTRAIGVYEAQGTPITGGMSPADSPLLSAGQYLDVLEKGSEKNSTAKAGSTRYYKVQLAPGERAHAAATLLVPRRGETDTSGTAFLSVSFVDAKDNSCLIQDAEHANSNQSFLFPPTAALSTPALGEDAADKCFGAEAEGEAFLKVERSGSSGMDQSAARRALVRYRACRRHQGPARRLPCVAAPGGPGTRRHRRPGGRRPQLQHRRRAQARPVLRLAPGRGNKVLQNPRRLRPAAQLQGHSDSSTDPPPGQSAKA